MNMMIDLETLDTGASAVIVSVGAVVFDTEKILRTGYYVLDQKEQIKAGRTISDETLAWWMKQSDQARSVFAEPKMSLQLFSIKFRELFEKDKICLWGNGSDFDLSILVDFWKTHDLMSIPGWAYYNHRCFRTFNASNECKSLAERKGTHHNALDDAIYQSECILAAWKKKS